MAKPLHVTHVVPAVFGYEGVLGGAERYALELARNMAARTPTTLLSFGKEPKEWQDGDLRVVVVRNWVPFRRFTFDPFGPSFLSHLDDADVVHVHQTHTLMASMALVRAHLSEKPVFATHLGGAGLGLHRLFSTDRYFDGHLHISEFSRRAFGHAGRIDARVISGGVDSVRFSPPRTPARRDAALYTGRLLPHKGINYLIEGVGKDVPLEIVGHEWRHASAFADLLRRLADGKNVAFHYDYNDRQMIEAYQRALCIVLPSVHETVDGQHYSIPELLGQTLLEGMACGAPAIATSVCSLPEVVEDGVSGFIVPPNDPAAIGDKIDRLRKDPELAKRMGAAARHRIETHFTWSRVVDRCFAAYGHVDAIPQREEPVHA